MKAYREKNPSAYKRRFAEWRAKNAVQDRLNSNEWRRQNAPKVRAALAQRKAALLRRTPGWADFKEIELIYEHCDYLSRLTGTPHNVDHIYPLQGKNVSGLHVHQNLQILTQQENFRKGNRYDNG